MDFARPHPAVQAPQGVAADLSRDLHRSREPGERMQVGVDLAVTLIPACDHAGITLVSGKSISAGAASDDVVARADEIQHDLAQGPCVDVARWENRSLYVADLGAEPRWPQWSRQVRAELGVGSLLSMLLFTHDRSFGAINLYSDRIDAFKAADVAVAQTLAAHLAVAVSDGKEIQDRDRGMVTRTVIGQAEGILMERYKIGDDEAFAYLRRISQDTNRKLVQIAQELVETRQLPQVGPAGHDDAVSS